MRPRLRRWRRGGTAILSRCSDRNAKAGSGWSAQSYRACGRDGAGAVGRDARRLPARAHGGAVRGGNQRAADYRLCIDWDGVIQETEDPYSFPPLLGELDVYLLAEGRHRRIAECLGAQPMTCEGAPGVRFAVWAPNARRVSVIGAFNTWDGRRHPMRLRHGCGVWEIFIPRLGAGELYKYEILRLRWQAHGARRSARARGRGAAGHRAPIVADATPLAWSDAAWQGARRPARRCAARDLRVTRLPGDVTPTGGRSRGRTGRPLCPLYVRDLGFTHVELLPVCCIRFAAPGDISRLAVRADAGTRSPGGFAGFVDRCHAEGIGVILDWVPAHFPNDAHGLARFDGTALYQHLDPREGVHREWNTYIYNLGRNEVRGFLIGSACFGSSISMPTGCVSTRSPRCSTATIRGRKASGSRTAMADGKISRRSISCRSFEVVAEEVPGAMLVAEESTAWPGVTRAADAGGLGFTHKWNMGWMHDTLRYISHEPVHRSHHHDDLTFGLLYAFFERFVLPISHDEVVYGKRSLLGRMPGDNWQRFANLQVYLFMWTHPGKKLLFMGTEFGQPEEWNHDTALAWRLLEDPMHAGVRRLLGDLNALFRGERALYARLPPTDSAGSLPTIAHRVYLRGCGWTLTAVRRCSWCAISRLCRDTTTAWACRRRGGGVKSSTRMRRRTADQAWAIWEASQRRRIPAMDFPPRSR